MEKQVSPNAAFKDMMKDQPKPPVWGNFNHMIVDDGDVEKRTPPAVPELVRMTVRDTRTGQLVHNETSEPKKDK